MTGEFKNWLASFLVEVVVYAALVVGYYFLVLHLMGDWLFEVFKSNTVKYTAISLGLIIVQGVVLESATRLLLGWIRSYTRGS